MAAAQDPTLSLPFAIIHRIGPAPIVFPFPINPQRARWGFPPRNAVHQTLHGAYVDDLSGRDSVLAQVTLEGTFGYTSTGSLLGLSLPPGSVTLKVLETIYETFHALDRQTKRTLGATQEYIGLSRLHYWEIAIRDFSYTTSARDPLLLYYTLSFIRIRDYLSPAGPSLPTGVPGVSQGLGGALGGLLG